MLSDSLLQCAGDAAETQLPCPPEDLPRTDAARATLKKVEDLEARLEVSVEEQCSCCLANAFSLSVLFFRVSACRRSKRRGGFLRIALLHGGSNSAIRTKRRSTKDKGSYRGRS